MHWKLQEKLHRVTRPLLYKVATIFFACHQILPDNLKAMPAEEAIEK
jgi:hypothetical protein